MLVIARSWGPNHVAFSRPTLQGVADMKVGFIGLGGIGKPMAISVARAGFELTVNDLREEPLTDLEQHGARVAGTAREVASASDIVLASLPSNEASVEVALGGDGVLAGASNGEIYIELSTISPKVVRRISREAAEGGVEVLDAPVSGGLAQRREGRLSVMVGGDAATLARARPVLEAIGERIFHVGGTGAGATVKLVNNLLNAIGAVATMEALALGVKAGLSVESMKEVISESSGASRAFDGTVASIGRSSEPPPGETANMALRTIGKDIRLAVELAGDLGVPLSVGSSALQLYLAGFGHGWADKESWVIMELVEHMSGVRVRPRGAGGRGDG
ncbi:MAG: NAD(P)-dependent oxidoreductase [Gammaproteobacteria bacterium]|nr:NAD(P)-dependent oxidoreductase [Gammaproteobacteria bacterium]